MLSSACSYQQVVFNFFKIPVSLISHSYQSAKSRFQSVIKNNTGNTALELF